MKHQHVFIAGNHFDDSTQTLHLEDIKDLTLNQEEEFLKVEKLMSNSYANILINLKHH